MRGFVDIVTMVSSGLCAENSARKCSVHTSSNYCSAAVKAGSWGIDVVSFDLWKFGTAFRLGYRSPMAESKRQHCTSAAELLASKRTSCVSSIMRGVGYRQLGEGVVS